MTRYGMAIDTKRCFGCQTCSVACKMANNLPKDIIYNHVYASGGDQLDQAEGVFPDLSLSYQPTACQHCDNPSCLAVCPTGATIKREDGIVYVDVDACIGCGACVTACPYEGVRTISKENPEYYLDITVGEADAPTHLEGVAEKCTFCYNLIDRGEVPACMQLCPGRARYWGDLDDPESEINKAIEGREYQKLNEDAGTSPNVFYLV